jgi:hypothetical protein
MKALLAALSAALLISCAPLNPHNTIGEDIGEVALRVVGCPLTFCISELALHDHRRKQVQAEAQALAQQEKQRQYQEWYQTLSPEEKAREDYNRMEIEQRELDRLALQGAAAMQALGMMNLGRGTGLTYTPSPIIRPPVSDPMPVYQPAPHIAPRQPMDCTSRQVGNQVHTNCY